MTKYAIVTDLDRCVGCLSCSVGCKVINQPPIGKYYNKVLRVGPNPKEGGSGNWPDIEMYYLNVSCQHCENAFCVEVCPTEASHYAADGTVQIDKEKCIGCQFCVMSCPYNVRYLNPTERVVEKCTLCENLISAGGVPQCVSQCCGMARWFGDLDADPTYASFVGPRGEKFGDYCDSFTQDQVYKLPDEGNKPSYVYIMRRAKWQTGEN